jgi:hypothetical protein
MTLEEIRLTTVKLATELALHEANLSGVAVDPERVIEIARKLERYVTPLASGPFVAAPPRRSQNGGECDHHPV